VKTEYSEDELPLDPDFAPRLLDWKRCSSLRPCFWLAFTLLLKIDYAKEDDDKPFEVCAVESLSADSWQFFAPTYMFVY
jgi:hypothetical protein